MAASAASQSAQGLLSLADLNFILINKLFVLLVVLLFFSGVLVLRRLKNREVPSVAGTALKLSIFGLVLLYFEATLTGFPNYRSVLTNIQSVIVLVVLAKLVIYLIVDVVLSLRRHGDVPMLLRDAIRLAVYLAAGIVSLRLVFQVDLSAVITTTTVITAAIAFAMQTTLSNAFYGFSVQIDPLMSRGNWITLPEKNLFGEIINVGFRYITLRTLENNKVLVPNTVVIQSLIQTHGALQEPAKERAAQTLTIGLPYELPPEEARSLLLGVLGDEESLILPDPQPAVRLWSLGDSSISYQLKFWLADPQQRTIALDRIQTKAWYAINRSGWSFPFPHRQLVTEPMRPSFPPSREAVLEGLRHSHLFDVLSDEEIGYLADQSHLKVFAPGEAAVRQGEAGSSLFFVLQGTMSIEVDGHEVAILERGRMFGEMSLLTGAPRSATVRARTETRLAEVQKENFAGLMERNDRLLEKLSEALERHASGLKDHQANRTGASGTNIPTAADYLRKLKSFFLGG